MSGIGREVAKKFIPALAWRLKISDRNFDQQRLDAWHSSRASTTTKTLEYIAARD